MKLKLIILVVCILILGYIMLAFVPMVVHLTYENRIVEKHIDEFYTENVSLNFNVFEAFKWLNGSNIPYGGRNMFPLFLGGGIYKINNKTMLFIKPNFVSWFILTKTGNCGEHAIYLTEILRRLNYDVVTLHAQGGDHSIIMVTDNNVSFFIDPSSKRIIEEDNYFENGQWARIMAIDKNGSNIDLTNDLLKNKSELTVFKNESQRIKIMLGSTYLMNRDDMYTGPIFVYEFDLKNGSDAIIVSSGEDYIITYCRDFILFRFVTENKINLTKNMIINVEYVPLSTDNLRMTAFGWNILIIVVFLILIIIVKQFVL